MHSFCVIVALDSAQVNEELKEKLSKYKAHSSSCEPVSMRLICRAAKEMLLAHKRGQALVAATKMVSILLIIGEGYEKVFRENVLSLRRL